MSNQSLLEFNQKELQRTNERTKQHFKYMGECVKKLVKKMEAYENKHKSRSIRQQEATTKKLTTVAIHKKNQTTIQQLQQEARDKGFFLSKENIINMGVELLNKKCTGEGVSVVDLFQEYEL